MKIARCVPVYKGNQLDPEQAVNYRPISILNAINKVFEKLIHKQLISYLEEEKILPQFQFGYRKQHNTGQAILDYTDHVTKSLQEGLVTVAIFMDLSKAFDTVDQKILDLKLEEMGLDENARKLIYNYMTNRKFCMNEDKNILYDLDRGVPQGSILGPLLFIMYTYDMKFISENVKSIVYADDTTILVTGRTAL